MKFVKKLFYNIPDQVFSTFMLAGMGYILYKGIVATINDPPSRKSCLVVICIGVLLGVLASLIKISNGKNVKKD
jgi:xanthine/uracil permease